MNSKDKLDLILHEEEMYQQRRRTELMELRTIMESPAFAESTFDNPYRYQEIEPGRRNITVFDLEIPSTKAAVITKIGTEWAPGLKITFKVDNTEKRVEEKDTGNPNDPVETKMLAKKRITWQVTNNREESYHFGVLTDGFYIPEEYYDRLADLYHRGEEMSL